MALTLRARRLAVERFWLVVAALAAAGVALRVGYVLALGSKRLADPDYALWYAPTALHLSQGLYMVDGTGSRSSLHPPLFPFVLALADLLGISTPTGHAVFIAVLNGITVLAAGYTGRIIGGPFSGVIAALFTAFSPTVWMYHTWLISEDVALVAISLFLLTAYALWVRPTARRALLLGAVVGVCGLARTEELSLLVLGVLPLILLMGAEPLGRRLRLFGIAALGSLAVLFPVVINNLLTFREPELVSTEMGSALLDTTCYSVWSGDLVGYVDVGCYLKNPQFLSKSFQDKIRTFKDESQADYALRAMAFHYYTSHLREVPSVVAARIGRILHLYRPLQMAKLDASSDGMQWPIYGAYAYEATSYLFYVLAAIGLWYMRYRGVTTAPIVALIGETLLVAAALAGYTRYAASLSVPLCLAAAAGTGALVFDYRVVLERAALVGGWLWRLVSGPSTYPLMRRVLYVQRAALVAVVAAGSVLAGASALSRVGAPVDYVARVDPSLTPAVAVNPLPAGVVQLSTRGGGAGWVALVVRPADVEVDILAMDGSSTGFMGVAGSAVSVSAFGSHQLVLYRGTPGFTLDLVDISSGTLLRRSVESAPSLDRIIASDAASNLAILGGGGLKGLVLMDPTTGKVEGRAVGLPGVPVAGALHGTAWEVVTRNGFLVQGRGARMVSATHLDIPRGNVRAASLASPLGLVLLVCDRAVCRVGPQHHLNIATSGEAEGLLLDPAKDFLSVFIRGGPQAYLATYEVPQSWLRG